MISFTNGNMFEKMADIQINTVNCVGVMGAGVALAFKKQYPEMYKDYKKRCENGEVKPGNPHVWSECQLTENIIIVNLPTKNHWRYPSKYEYIESGLKWLKEFLGNKGSVSVTLPALGCGHGGLEWDKVKSLIQKYLSELEADIFVFEPSDTHKLNKQDQIEFDDLKTNGVHIINSSDPNYPKALKGRYSLPIYVKGEIDDVATKGLVILPSSNIETREEGAALSCLNLLSNSDITYILGYNSGDRYILKKLLEARRKVIICIDEGILNFKIKKDVEDYWDDSLVSVVSVMKPTKAWAKYNHKLSTEFKISLGLTTLIVSENPKWLLNSHNDIRNLLKKCFYVNYGSVVSSIYEFYARIGAFPVSKDRNGIPKLNKLLECYK